MNLPSSLARYRHMLAISSTSDSRPNGTFHKNLLRFSGVSGTPVNSSKRPVPQRRGETVLTRMLWGPYSAARPLVAFYLVSSGYAAWRMKIYIGHRSFGCVIPDQSRSWTRGSRGGDVDHRTSLALFDQSRHEGVGAVEDALDVDVEHALPFCFRDFCRGLFNQHPPYVQRRLDVD